MADKIMSAKEWWSSQPNLQFDPNYPFGFADAYARYYHAEASKGLEQKYRELLWRTHGHDGLYGDDGQMTCSDCLVAGWACDYRNDALSDLELSRHAALLHRVNVAVLAAHKEAVGK